MQTAAKTATTEPIFASNLQHLHRPSAIKKNPPNRVVNIYTIRAVHRNCQLAASISMLVSATDINAIEIRHEPATIQTTVHLLARITDGLFMTFT